MQPLVFRTETQEDYPVVEALIRDAFWGLTSEICDEPYLAHQLREDAAFVPELDLVAVQAGEIVGHVLFSTARVVGGGQVWEVLNFGPLSVKPTYQSRGVGRALMACATQKAAKLGYRGIVFYGYPDYYPRLGFKRAAGFGILSGEGKEVDALMAMELYPGAFAGVGGRYEEAACFNVDAAAARSYGEEKFPPRPPARMAPLETLYARLSPTDCKALAALALPHLGRLSMFGQREIEAAGVSADGIRTVQTTLREQGYRWGRGLG